MVHACDSDNNCSSGYRCTYGYCEVSTCIDSDGGTITQKIPRSDSKHFWALTISYDDYMLSNGVETVTLTAGGEVKVLWSNDIDAPFDFPTYSGEIGGRRYIIELLYSDEDYIYVRVSNNGNFLAYGFALNSRSSQPTVKKFDYCSGSRAYDYSCSWISPVTGFNHPSGGVVGAGYSLYSRVCSGSCSLGRCLG